jgi:hypothetical protein
MDKKDVVALLIAGGLLLFFGLPMIWGLLMQRRAVRQQSKAIDSVEESMDVSWRNSQMVARLVELAEASARQQDEVIRLLRVLCERQEGTGPKTDTFTKEKALREGA